MWNCNRTIQQPAGISTCLNWWNALHRIGMWPQLMIIYKKKQSTEGTRPFDTQNLTFSPRWISSRLLIKYYVEMFLFPTHLNSLSELKKKKKHQFSRLQQIFKNYSAMWYKNQVKQLFYHITKQPRKWLLFVAVYVLFRHSISHAEFDTVNSSK